MAQTNKMLSVDFWDTLVVAETGGEERMRTRHEAIMEVADSYIERLPVEEVEEASRQASVEFNRVWFGQGRTPTTDELVNNILNHLGIPATKKELDYLVKTFEESLWEGPPELAEGARDIIPQLGESYNLTLISDTMFSPGRVIRQYLAGQNLYDHFNGFVFSDEQGYSKPNPKAFELMLEKTGSRAEDSCHVGDLYKTDIRGAREAGMRAILFTGLSGPADREEDDPEPDHICQSWEEVREVLL